MLCPERPRVDLGDYLGPVAVDTSNKPQLHLGYLVARSVANFGAMSTGFFTVYALGEVGVWLSGRLEHSLSRCWRPS